MYQAEAVELAERHVSRQLRLAYLAPEVLKRLTCGREAAAATIMQLTESAGLPWVVQAGVVFEAKHRLFLNEPLVEKEPR